MSLGNCSINKLNEKLKNTLFLSSAFYSQQHESLILTTLLGPIVVVNDEAYYGDFDVLGGCPEHRQALGKAPVSLS